MGISKAVAPRVPKDRPFRLLKGVSVLSDLADGNAVYGYPGDYRGRIYFVNNITGSSSNDGLSWETPFDQISTAVTASEIWRQAYSGTTNDYCRNIIYVQGTGTAYTAMTVLPICTDLIGIGSDPRGDGLSIVVVKSAAGDAAAGDARGLYMTNIQFASAGGTSYFAMDTGVFLSSTVENCTFMNYSGTAPLGAGWRASNHFAGSTIRNCAFGMTNGAYGCNIGFSHSGGVGNNNLFENNIFFGIVHGACVAAGINDHGTVWKDNLFHTHLGTTECSTAGLQMGLYSIAVKNVMVGADAITENDATQTVWNIVQAGDASVWEDDGP